MKINLNIKIKGGKRTPVEVDVYSTSVNEKTIEFANGTTIDETEIATWLEKELTRVLKKLESKEST